MEGHKNFYFKRIISAIFITDCSRMGQWQKNRESSGGHYNILLRDNGSLQPTRVVRFTLHFEGWANRRCWWLACGRQEKGSIVSDNWEGGVVI